MKASFDLGRLSSVQFAVNSEVLRVMGESIARAIRSDAVGIAVYRNGIGDRAVHCHFTGPKNGQSESSTPWTMDDRALARALSVRQRGKVFRRSELTQHEDAPPAPPSPLPPLPRVTNGAVNGHVTPAPIPRGDQALCLFTRSDGADLIVGIRNLPTGGSLTDADIASFQKVVSFAAVAWAARWRNEPAWIAALKPQGRTILELVLAGYDDVQIAERTGLTYHSVRAHLKRLFREADVRSRLHLMQACREAASVYHSLVMDVNARIAFAG